jgi:ATP-dependent Clp protease ATP-binding subunit ClpC
MIRLDMSEFQTPETTHKILGGEDIDSLVNRVRKQPFSVVLLDEFEKANATSGTCSCRCSTTAASPTLRATSPISGHCMIILTTNLGATSHRTSGLGFAPAADAFSNDQITARDRPDVPPRVQNRLDKVIVFQPAQP